MLLSLIALRIAGKVDNLKAKHPDLSAEIDEIHQKDPSKNDKYIDWSVRQILRGHSLNDIIPTVELFHKKFSLLEKKDINQYKDLKDLENILKSLPESSKTQEKIKSKTTGSVKLYEDGKFVLIRIDEKRACVEYGKGTKWCISMKDASFFARYRSENVVFYFLINKAPTEEETRDSIDKIAFAVHRDRDMTEIFKSNDDTIKSNPYSEISGKIDQIIKSDLPSAPETKLYKLKKGKLSEEEIREIVNDDDDDTNYIHSYLSESPNTPPDILAKLSDNDDYMVRLSVAENPSTPPEILAKLASDGDEVRRSVAHNPSTPPEILSKLAEDEYRRVRLRVARNPNTPPEALSRLADDKDTVIRQNVANNPDTPPGALAKLADDNDDVMVRGYVAENPSTPPEALAKLADDEYRQVRSHVAENRNTPLDILSRLADDLEGSVRLSVAGNPNTPPEILTKLADDVSYNVAENPSTPPETLAKLAKDEDRRVRLRVARNSSAPPEILAKLAEDEDRYVRQYVAENNSTSPEILIKLADDLAGSVRNNVAGNHNTPPEILAKLADDDNEEVRNTAKKRLNLIIGSDQGFFRYTV